MGGIVKKQAEAVVPAALRREAAARYLSISPGKGEGARNLAMSKAEAATWPCRKPKPSCAAGTEAAEA